MAKNVFSILNYDCKIWVNIFNYKYKDWLVLNPGKIAHSSWFYKLIFNSFDFLKPYLKLISCNSSKVDLWNDPCILDLPISKKPTFLNMSIHFEDVHFSNFINSNGMCLESLENFLGLLWTRIGLPISKLCQGIIIFRFGTLFPVMLLLLQQFTIILIDCLLLLILGFVGMIFGDFLSCLEL